jgi:hypothetical protein
MASTINASTAGVGGVITTADNTGILNIQTAGTTAVTVNASQNVGIGTTSPTEKVTVTGNMSSTANGTFYIDGTNAGTVANPTYSWVVDTDTGMYRIQANTIGFATAATERMRVDASGNLLVGTTTAPAANGGGIAIYKSDYARLSFRNSTTGDAVGDGTQVYAGGVDFVVNNAEATGRIYMTSNTNGVYLAANATSWTANSDERLKTDLMPIENAADKVSTLRAVTGRFKTDDEGTSRSFLIAQDVQAVLPEAVNVQDDEQGTLGVQYTDVIPLLVAAIKELKAEIDLLKGVK